MPGFAKGANKVKSVVKIHSWAETEGRNAETEDSPLAVSYTRN